MHECHVYARIKHIAISLLKCYRCRSHQTVHSAYGADSLPDSDVCRIELQLIIHVIILLYLRKVIQEAEYPIYQSLITFYIRNGLNTGFFVWVTKAAQGTM